MSDVGELYRRGYDILSNRQRYELKQRKYYLARHEGIRRTRKPFPTAADLHLALIDETINKLKPFTLAQVTGTEKLAVFVAMKQQLAEHTASAGDFFSFELKERSNFLRVLETVVDTMWLRGRGIMKAYVDPFDDYRVVHENIDPLFLLMPDDCNDFEDAYEWIHVRQINVAKFKLDRRYCQEYREEDGLISRSVLEKMCGGADAVERLKTQRGRDFDLVQEDKEIREGYTHTANADTIIIWEHVVQTRGGYVVYPYCPVAMDVVVRKPYGIPYKVNGKVSAGYFSFPAEVKDEGWYAPRGVAEKIFDNEIYACKVWNAKADSITFFNTPMLTSETPIQNPANYRFAPGEYMPGNARAVQFGQPAMSFDQEIMFTRGEAEQRVMMPDMAIEKPSQRGNEKRTAKEVSVAASLGQVGQNHSASVFKQSLSQLFRHDWGLMLQYKRKSLAYFMAEDLQTVPQDALHEEYLIYPGGATDDWDKNQRMAKASQRFQELKGAPNVNQDELVRDLLASDDARLVKRLLVPSNIKAATEAEDEAQEITSMMVTHFAAPVKPGEDHMTRIKTLLQFLMGHGQKGMPVDNMAKQRIQQHLAAHMQYLKQQNPKAAAEVVKMIRAAEKAPMQQAPQAQPQRPQIPQRTPQPAASGMSMI